MLQNRKTLVDLLADRTEEHPNKIWLKELIASGSKDWTWREARMEINAVACWASEQAKYQ